MNDGSQKITFARLEVESVSSVSRSSVVAPCFVRDGANRVKSTIYFNPYEPELFPTAPAEVELGYYYATGKNCQGQQALTKPILIIDGFDPEDKRSIGEIFGENLLINGSTRNLGDSLQRLGYDVVIANFPVYQIGTDGNGNPVFRDGGADYIERNAMGIIEVIKLLNQEMQAAGSTEQLVVVGPSMGGLISRYALAYMEKHNIPHNTRLWVSFDSPHNGANISIGAQEFLRYWGGQGSAGAQKAYDVQINSIAAKQMLLWHRNVGNFPRTPQAHWYRNTFNQNLNNNGISNSGGFPMNLRKIALVNGSISGQLSGVAGEKNLQMDLWMRVLTGNLIKVGDSWINNTGSYGNQQQAIYCWKIRATRVDEPAAPSNSISYDIAPGGTFNTYETIRDLGQGDIQVNGVWIRPLYSLNKTSHSFIPTKSALAFKGSNQDLGESLNNRNLVCTNETPFDAYYAPNENQDHVALTQESVDWFLGQLNFSTSPPLILTLCNAIRDVRLEDCRAGVVTYQVSPNISVISYQNRVLRVRGESSGQGFVKFFIDGILRQENPVNVIKVSENDLVGSNLLCNTPQTYTLQNVPSFASVSWQTSPNISPSSGSGNVATIAYTGTGDAWIEFVIAGCNQRIRKSINSLANSRISGREHICGVSESYSTEFYPTAQYSWSASPNLSLSSTSTTTTTATVVGSGGSAWIEVNIVLDPSCPNSNTKTIRKDLWIGPPQTPVICQPNFIVCTPLTAPYNLSFCRFEQVSLNVLSSGAERIVSSVNGSPIQTLQNGVLNINTNQVGTFVYSIAGVNRCGASPVLTLTVNIASCNRELENKKVQIYPNPTENILNLEFAEKQEQAVRYELYNPYSQKVAWGSFTEKCSIDVSKLPKNVYFLHLYYPDGSNEKRQIVVQR